MGSEMCIRDSINTPDGIRPTVQEKSQSGTESHKMAYLDDIIKEVEELKVKFNSIIKCYKPIEGDDLINVIKKGGDITLMTNVNGNSSITLTKKSDIDLNGYTISCAGSSYGDCITIGNYADITLKNGTINPADNASVTNNSATIMIATKYTTQVTLENVTVKGLPYAIYMNNTSGNSQLTINSGNYYTDLEIEPNVVEPPVVFIEKSGNRVFIKGGTFGKAGKVNRYLLNIDDKLITEGIDPRTFITVTGGTFYNFDPSNCISEGEGTNFVADGYKVISKIKNTDTIYEVIPE